MRILFGVLGLLGAIVFSGATLVQAADLSVGAATWYTAWEYKSNEGNPPRFDPGLMYGPALSLRFSENWNISSVLLYGRFVWDNPSSDYIERFDWDTSLNYLINRYLKVFGGLKYMGFYWESGDSNRGHHRSMGPGLGVGLTVPLSANFFLLVNASGLYTVGEHKDTNAKTDIQEYGINTTAALAYYISGANTSIQLGGRFQYIRADYKEEDRNSDSDMYFYGVTLTAVYTFDFNK